MVNKVLVGLGIFVMVSCAFALAYRHLRPAEIDRGAPALAKEDRAPLPTPSPQVAEAPAVEPQPAPVASPVPLPKPRPLEAVKITVIMHKDKPPRKHSSAAHRLKSKWVAPPEQPFAFGELFHVR